MNGFREIRGNFANIDKLERTHSVRHRESRLPVGALSDKMQPPHAVAEPFVRLVPEADHDVYRVDRIRTSVGPIGPIMLSIGSRHRIHFKAIRYSRLVAREDG